MRLVLAMLYAKDLPALKAFYTAVFGSAPLAETESDTWCEFEAGGLRFGLHAIPPQFAAGIEISSPPEPRSETPCKLVFACPHVEAAAERIAAAGGSVMRRPWGGIDGVDPEGNVFGLVTGPGAG